MIGYDTVGTGRGAGCSQPGQRTGYDTVGTGAGAKEGAGSSQPGHVTGYVTADEDRGAGDRPGPVPLPAGVPEPPKTNTAATIPTASTVC
ncbi:hypothetical protein [Streptomyces sp. NPDC003327]